ncbi:hypothetical protein BDZ94DRAFT_888808 [Collybia nuda]|uniref:Uncharacterized protein n=1 Tax=Collybia nuda TaxID=64659 RepID=A0A9P5Y3J6_9AGAR|nr:hypothetical protein BDZ94DRAFT_888808 [Collybia nuda]
MPTPGHCFRIYIKCVFTHTLKRIESNRSVISDMTIVSPGGTITTIDRPLTDTTTLPVALPPSPPEGVNDRSYNGRKRGSKVIPPILISTNKPYYDSPPSTPSQKLLPLDTPPPVQFATYPDHEIKSPPSSVESSRLEKDWVPCALRSWFWVPLVLIMAATGIGLEVALYFSNKNQGWPSLEMENQSALNYTLPPVAIAAVLVTLWANTDLEIKRLQPYIDLIHGDSPPHRSLLLDYTRINNFLVWSNAASNKHYLVTVASLMVIISLMLQPLASALLSVRDTWVQEPDISLKSLQSIGLNNDTHYRDLTSFLTAAGYASASVLYNLADPPFVNGTYTIANFQLPMNSVTNGTVFANTTAIKSETNCRPVKVNRVQRTDVPGWINTASLDGCSSTWLVDKSVPTLFGTNTPTCNPEQLPEYGPVIFWFFDYEPEIMASATFCYPSITLWDVNVSIDLASGNVTDVKEIRPFTSQSNFSSYAGNITGTPLNGRAYNGIYLNFTQDNEFISGRRNATRLQLPAAVYHSAQMSEGGTVGSYHADTFFQWTNQVYTMYLSLVARAVYFLDVEEPLTVQLKTFKKRVWLSDTAVHLLSGVILLLASLGTIVHLLHRLDRRGLRLRHEPGTIASAVSIGAQTGMGALLSGMQDSRDISQALEGKKFRIHPETMKIVMEGEEGYEYAESPEQRRGSIFASFQSQRRPNPQFSRIPSNSTTQRSNSSFGEYHDLL